MLEPRLVGQALYRLSNHNVSSWCLCVEVKEHWQLVSGRALLCQFAGFSCPGPRSIVIPVICGEWLALWSKGRFGDRDHESVVRGVVSRPGCSYSVTLEHSSPYFDWLKKGTAKRVYCASGRRTVSEESTTTMIPKNL
jgi:hypothetical protein